jgi:hypothetical protein
MIIQIAFCVLLVGPCEIQDGTKIESIDPHSETVRAWVTGHFAERLDGMQTGIDSFLQTLRLTGAWKISLDSPAEFAFYEQVIHPRCVGDKWKCEDGAISPIQSAIIQFQGQTKVRVMPPKPDPIKDSKLAFQQQFILFL